MKYHVPTKMLVIVLRNLMQFFTEESLYHQGFFAVNGERFLSLGQCIVPRLFFMFLFLIPLTIRQQSIIYPHIFFTDLGDVCVVVWKNGRHFRLGEMPPLLIFKSRFWGLSVGWCACYFATFTAVPLERRKM